MGYTPLAITEKSQLPDMDGSVATGINMRGHQLKNWNCFVLLLRTGFSRVADKQQIRKTATRSPQ
jgi:hypothetical protein